MDLDFIFEFIRSGERSISLLSLCFDIWSRYLVDLVILRTEVFDIRLRLFVSDGFRAEVSNLRYN